MANKENELTCSDDVRGNAAEASKMAGASSKYSDFTEVRLDTILLILLQVHHIYHRTLVSTVIKGP